jgi:hypothetical protein
MHDERRSYYMKTIQEALGISSTPGTSQPSTAATSIQTNQSTPSTPSNDAAVKAKANAVQQKVAKAVSESADLITALECVGAMYGIPSTNIIADPNATGIRIQNDNIIAPPIEAKNQTKPIIQAVGGVLDYISQRIDDKLNDYQMGNIEQGRIDTAIKNANPAKGKCIGRYEDDEGGEILAYDTGLVDMPNTPAAIAKVEELRASNTIPTYVPGGSSAPQEYFNDEDEESIDMDASADDIAGDVTSNAEVNDIAENIQESAYHVNMCSKMGNTTHLGYDLLRKHGFDFVKPIDSIVMESKTEDDDKKKKVRTSDIKYMKFDNKAILKAVDYFNAARENQENAKQMNLTEFVHDPNFEKAIDCLNKQFDCRINLRFIQTKPGKYENAATQTFNDIKKKMSISKSKGFQLGGLPIDIFIYNHYLESSAPNDIELFGQNMVSTLCHEIFHNIASVLRHANATAGMSLAMTLNLAAAAKTPEEKRVIITNYVDTIDELSGNNLINKAAKKRMVKQLTTLAAVDGNPKAMRSVGDADKYADQMIKAYKKAISKATPSKAKYVFPAVITAAGVLTACLGGSGLALFGGLTAGAGAIMGIGMLTVDLDEIEMMKKYSSAKLYEEYYCDLFAAMYKLPKFFFIGPSKNKYVANDFSTDKLTELAKLEGEFSKAIYSKYPTDLERTHAGVKVAKQLLEQKNLEPQVKKYCQWIVDNFSNVNHANIDTIYNKSTFDPKEAENLDKHLEDIIKDNNVTLTESFQQWVNNNEEIF